MATTDERLTMVRDAIDVLVTGRVAAYTHADRSYTYLTLGELQRLESSLVTRLARETNGGIVMQGPRFCGW